MTTTTAPDAQAGQENAEQTNTPETVPASSVNRDDPAGADPAKEPEEVGGPAGPEPTRYGDWEKKGRCIDF